MLSPTDALQAAQRPPPPRLDGRQRAIVIGAGGALGSALLEQALAGERFAGVAAVVTAPLRVGMRGLQAVTLATLPRAGAELAFLVFERHRHANGRDDTFLRPQVDQLASLAASLHGAGVRRLLVVVPHAPALLPQALKAGLGTLDEAAVAALGFEQLVFVRAATAGARRGGGSWLDRAVGWWLSQLAWMVPQREQPVRTARLAELVVQLAARLPQARPGTRVLAPELLWQAAQPDGGPAVLDAWLGPHEPGVEAQRR